jgi:CRISPR-associated protein Cmr5
MTDFSMRTKNQTYAHLAFGRITKWIDKDNAAEYRAFARRFPSLVHTCGLAQAVAFAQQKAPKFGEMSYLKDLADVVMNKNIEKESRNASLSRYLIMSRETLNAAGWLKRYAEALIETSGESDDSV